jgi:hypothetical protein
LVEYFNDRQGINMRTKGQPVSKTSTGAWCRPNDGYAPTPQTEQDIASYVEVDQCGDPLPDSDEQWPKGAAIAGHFKVGNKIVREI